MKIRIGKILSVVLACAMCLTTGVTVFAGDADPTPTVVPTAKKAKIVKELQVPGGTSITETFKFNVTSTTADAPVIKTEAEVDYAITAGDSVKKEIETVDDLFANAEWKHAGEYVYTITEVQGNTTGMTYSKAEYKVTVVVQNDDTATNTNKLSVKTIYAQKTKDDNGQPSSVKVDPNPSNPQAEKLDDIHFVNTYVKDKTVDPTDPEDAAEKSAMTLEKQVTGDIGDKTREFVFTVSASNPEIGQAKNQKIYAHILKADGKTWKETDPFEVGTNTQVKLAHGEKLVFTSIYAGATVTFKEAAVTGYTVTTSVTNNSVTTAPTTVTSTGVTVEPVYEDGAFATVTNELDSTAPTGILINNLPFILLILAAVVGFVAYITVRRRRVSGN